MTITVNGQSGHCYTDDARPVLLLSKPGQVHADCLTVEVHDAEGQCIWESGRIPFSPQVPLTGILLKPKTAYTITAGLYTGKELSDSAALTLETGFLGTAWEAGWIEPQQDPGIREEEIPFHELFRPNPAFFGGQGRLRPCREIRKTFSLAEVPASSRLYVSAHGIYSLIVNGKTVSDRQFAPETSSYQERLYYQVYDPSDLLTQGENEISLTLADGWWIGRIGISGDSCQYGDHLGCIMQLDAAYPSGTSQVLGSDASFQGRRSRIDYADLFIGQGTDFAREEEPWSPCTAVDYPTTNLIAQPIAPVVEYDRLPAELILNAAGELIADFGRVIAGVADISVTCEPGREVTLDFCEVLDEQGNYLRNILGRNKDQRDTFTCGEGTTQFSPEFTYHGFRYMRISGVKPEEITNLSARAFGTDLTSRGMFHCSDERLNRLQENIRSSMRANFFSVPTDCPQREKAGWTGDVAAFASTGCFNYHIDGFLRGWLENMKVEQLEDGGIPVVIPNYPMQEKHQKGNGGSTSSAWSDACVLVPWELYRQYGDLEILASTLPMMDRWVEYSIRQCSERPEDFAGRPLAEQHWNGFLMNTGFHFGDWFIPSFQRTGKNPFEASAATKDVTASCYHAIVLARYAEILRLLNADDPRIKSVEDRLEQVREAVLACYVAQDGKVTGDLQGLYVVLLHAGIVHGELRQKVVDNLVRLVRENGTRLDTGFVSTPLLLGTLADNGELDLAFELLFQTEAPSWLYMVEKGATSIWENWEAIRPDGSRMASSFNHFALGSVGDFLYRYIAGIQIEEAGYRKILFSPIIDCGLSSAEAGLETAYGYVSCSWRWEGDTCSVAVTVPQDCGGTLRLFGRDEPIPSGTHLYRFSRDGINLLKE